MRDRTYRSRRALGIAIAALLPISLISVPAYASQDEAPETEVIAPGELATPEPEAPLDGEVPDGGEAPGEHDHEGDELIDEAEAPEADAIPERIEDPDAELVELSGSILVLPTEVAAFHVHEGETPETTITHEGSVTLYTDEGAKIALDDLPIGADGVPQVNGESLVTGQRVTVQLEVSPAVQLEVAENLSLTAEELVLEQPETAQLVAEVAEELDEPLRVMAFSAEPAAPELGAASRAHTIDVVFLNKAGSGAPNPTVAQLNGAVTRLEAFWKRNSGGQVSSIRQGMAPKIRTVSGNVCDPLNYAWPEAARMNGYRDEEAYWMSTSQRHLMVIVPADLCGEGNGLGSIGQYGVNSGGVIWAVVDTKKNWKYGDAVIAHEFGHNMSLGHSNVLDCNSGQLGGSCRTHEYYDLYDVMGAGFTYYGSGGTILHSSSDPVPDISATHKTRLGSNNASELPRTITAVGGRVQTYSLNSSTSTSGTRALRVVDPKTSETLFVEYRAGRGRESGALYSANLELNLSQSGCSVTRYRSGIRVLKQAASGTSVALERKSNNICLPYFLKGNSVSTTNGEVKIKVDSISGGTSQVTVEFPSAFFKRVHRVAGNDRYVTAVAVSKHGYPDASKVNTVVIAAGTNHPDSLSAAPWAAKLKAPLLLTAPASLDAATKAELKRLKPKQIYIVGGTGAVSAKVQSDLKAYASKVERVAGADRFATSAAVVRKGWPNGHAEVFIATGLNFPDALSASSAAGSRNSPVLLVPGWQSAVPATSDQALKTLKATRMFVVGGPGVVSKGMENSLKSRMTAALPKGTSLKPVIRFAGNDRFHTSALVSQRLSAKGAQVYLANGMGFADALTGVPVAGVKKAPLLLTQQNCIPAKVRTELSRIAPPRTYLLGGTGALSNNVALGRRC